MTSHYVPEGLDAVRAKIAYLETIIDIGSTCQDASEMIRKVNKAYPNYSGDNYLEMTANFFFPRGE